MDLLELVEICQGEVIKGDLDKYKKIRNLKLDSQKIKKNDLFIALKGKRFDGHDFILEAINKGASAVIVEKEIAIETEIPIIKVKSTYDSLKKIAIYKRELNKIPLIAVTGSAGKTMTKDLIGAVLSPKYRVLINEKSDNNHIGVPKTLFNLNKRDEIIVLELGMNHQGEIKELSKICQPDVGVITNIGTAHIGNLGTKKNIFQAKMEILEGMNNGKLIINGDDKFLNKINKDKIEIITSGIKKNNHLIASEIKCSLFKTTFKIKVDNKEYKVVFNVPGQHLIINVLLAIQVGLLYEVPLKTIIKEIKLFKTKEKRMEIIKLKRNNILIEDCYNSSFESLIGVLELIKNNPFYKIIILGDILELGKHSKRIHKKVGHYLKGIPNKEVLLVGEKMKVLEKQYLHFDNNQDLIKELKEIGISNALILVKGSRLMKLEEITEYLKERIL